jgi:hypothetical protein
MPNPGATLAKSAYTNRLENLDLLLKLVHPIPEDWAGRTKSASKDGGTQIELLKCESWNELVNQWRKSMQWTEGLDRCLSIMLACAASTMTPDELLWICVISPASTGKTTLVEAVGTARKFTKTVSSFKGLHSGWQSDNKGEEDNSLMPHIKDKTLIIKDADPLLKSPNRDVILGDLRDAYDTNTAPSFKNKVKRDYTNHRFTTIICGTEAMLELDAAEVGARFLNVVIMRGIEEQFERSINHRVIHRITRNRGVSVNGATDSHDDTNKLKCKQMTGGYVEYLRRNASDLLAAIDVDSNMEEFADEIDFTAQFIAFLRARPAKKQDEVTSREMSARLSAQLSKLALCLAVVLNRPTVDAEVMRRVRQTAIDTARGRTFDICELLYKSGEDGMEVKAIAHHTNHTEDKERDLLRFMRRIGATLSFYRKTQSGQNVGGARWKMTPRMRRMWERVVERKVGEETVDG